MHERIREAFPAPVIADASVSPLSRYCVGGALCLTIADSIFLHWRSCGVEVTDEKDPRLGLNVPEPAELAVALAIANPVLADGRETDEDELSELPHSRAFRFAKLIIEANDASDFESAWRFLGLALTESGEAP